MSKINRWYLYRKFHHVKTQVDKVSTHPLPPNRGCPECNVRGAKNTVQITARFVTCFACGLKLPLEDYYDYLEQLKK